ncbi:MAG TPA: D-alanyl-D-alanine carboxypeptidase/D-alanyl-D-alanine-endopeptidase [Bacteroidales bacterium]|nr:D-alanyl-D-alanine carboxypeptidase/D-alanyl-D-alanine-endopeptidase [Bacteroidales bacterium]
MKKTLLFFLVIIPLTAHSQALDSFLADTSLAHASYSLYIADAGSGEAVLDVNSARSLSPASVLKVVTSAVALELLGPYHTFTTKLGYTGKLSRSGKLDGDIVIIGGGDPAMASPRFSLTYGDFPYRWVDEIKNAGIKKVKGRVITDDSYYDYLPVPSRWTWEDIGNYYGAGVYGASIFDNTYEITFNTLGKKPVITGRYPEECNYNLENYLTAEGTADLGYVFSAPYSTTGWIAGTIPAKRENFVLSASIPDPPFLFARIMDEKIRDAGIEIAGKPTTVRIEKSRTVYDYTTISEYISPILSEIMEVLNHESVNLYAETLVKELGKKYRSTGSAENGIKVIKAYLDSLGIDGMFIVDGSGLSPANSISAYGLASLLIHMKKDGKYFEYYLNSLPDAGREGTLKNYFKDEVFADCLKAKSGSMTRVRSYAGYFTSRSGREMVFAFIANDFSGPSANIVRHYEEILKETILQK